MPAKQSPTLFSALPRTASSCALRNVVNASLVAIALQSGAALAQNAPTPPAAPPAPEHRHEAGKPARAPELTLQANASREVKQDTINIVLEVRSQAATQPAAGKALTAALDALAKRARGNDGIELRTGNYRVYPDMDDKGKTTGWTGSGELRLESRDFAAASALAAKLSDASAIARLSFSLSREAREAEEKRLLTEAADAFKARAMAAAQAFGFSGYRMGKISLGGQGRNAADGVAPYMMASMARKGGAGEGAEVPLEPDTEWVTVDVNGTIFLQ